MTTINAVRYVAIVLLFLLAGCSHRVPLATVEVIDTSLSITPRALDAVLDAVQNQIVHMQRGDTLILIPITGDAANDAGGRILRLSAPTERETYDTDLRRFQEQARKQFAAWITSLDKHQSHTDILGALDAARQEFAVLPKESSRKLIVVSDFLEDDGTYRFISARSLANPVSARQLAEQLRAQHGFTSRGVPLCLGALKASTSPPSRRNVKKRSGHFGLSISRQGAKKPKSNLMAPGFSLMPTVAVLAENDNKHSGEKGVWLMGGSSFMQGWVALLGALAMVAIVLTAFGLMLGSVKPGDALKYLGASLGIVIVLMLAPGILVSAWAGLFLWQQIALIAIGIGVFQWLRPRRKRREESKHPR